MRRTLLGLALFACTPALAAKGAGVDVPDLPGTYTLGTPGAGAGDRPWWVTDADPALQALVTEGLSANLDVAQAQDRIDQAAALKLSATSALLPALNVEGAINAQPACLRFASLLGDGDTCADEGTLYFSGATRLTLGLEVDLTGRNVLGVQAAAHDLVAAHADRDTAALALASRIAGAWYDAALQQARLDLLERQLDVDRQLLEVVQLRLDRGEASAVEVLQQRQVVAALQAQLPLVRAAHRIAGQQLAVLLGRAPEDAPDTSAARLAELAPAPSTGTPDDLVDHRPDLAAADARFTSAWQRRMAAERQFLPTLRLSANGSWNYQNTAGSSAFGGGTSAALVPLYTEVGINRAAINQGLLAAGLDPLPDITVPDTSGSGTDTGIEVQNWFNWGIGATLTIPIFNGGRNVANLRAARAAERLAAHAATKARLDALARTESALTQDTEQVRRLDAVREQAQAASDAFDAARERYASGIGDYLTVLSTLVTSQNADLAALQAQRDALAARIQLHEALGGSWAHDLVGGSR